MPLYRDSFTARRPGSFEPQPLHIPAPDPAGPRRDAPVERARRNPDEELPGGHVVEIDIS